MIRADYLAAEEQQVANYAIALEQSLAEARKLKVGHVASLHIRLTFAAA